MGKEHNGISDCLGSNYCIDTEKKVIYGLMIFLGSQELKPRAVFLCIHLNTHIFGVLELEGVRNGHFC